MSRLDKDSEVEFDFDLASWHSILPEEEPTPNMMRWMQCFDVPCKKACCFSVDCAAINCDSCSISFTKIQNEHKRRYVCMQCELVGVTPLCDPTKIYRVPGTTLCHSCFESAAIPHEHSKRFCLVNEKGVHMEISRSVQPQNKISLTQSLLQIAPLSAVEGKDCFICCEPFAQEFPAVLPYGCVASHSHGVSDRTMGVKDEDIFYCPTCYLQSLKSSTTTDSPTVFPGSCLCLLCQHSKEMNSWRTEFCEELFQAVVKGGPSQLDATEKALHELHPQPWIRQVLAESAEHVRRSIRS